MASELRWILAAICVPFLLAIWWWGNRRSRQAPGNSELREPTLGAAVAPAHQPASLDASPPLGAAPSGERDWGVPPFEPLSIHTAEFDTAPNVLPMTAHVDTLEVTWDLESRPDGVRTPQESAPAAESGSPTPAIAEPPPPPPPPPPSPPAKAPVIPATAPTADPGATGANAQGPNVSETQRIVTVRVCAGGGTRWLGTQLMAALENHGLAHGRYQVFHRRHSDGRTLFCAASLAEPGTFDLARMPLEEFRGLSLFAVLPGPSEPLITFDAMLQTAVELAESLHGVVQDSKGAVLSQQGAAALRDDVARFQALLTMA